MSTTNTAQSLTITLRLWRDFLDSTSLSLPSSFSDSTSRISQNLTHYFSNYAFIVLLVLFLSFLSPHRLPPHLHRLALPFFLSLRTPRPLRLHHRRVDGKRNNKFSYDSSGF
uniref:PRA1 family protein n=1 Tax=Fagus sylvatica TaxID=28930 RepID=A0A2N9IIZ5_FAGSY